MSVYVVSDIHGQYNTFINGLKSIDFKDTDQLYVIGDAIDRGPDGVKLLLYIKEHTNIDLILGNHELLMIGSVSPDGKPLCSGAQKGLWLWYNGGEQTFSQYKELTDEKRLELLKWLNDRYVIKIIEVGEKRFCLTHSYYYPEFEDHKYGEIGFDNVWDITWRSMYRDDPDTYGEDIYNQYPYTFITGHVPVPIIKREYAGEPNYNDLQIFEKGNFIDIDGGCSIGYHKKLKNGLLFLRLDDMKVYGIPIEKTEV